MARTLHPVKSQVLPAAPLPGASPEAVLLYRVLQCSEDSSANRPEPSGWPRPGLSPCVPPSAISPAGPVSVPRMLSAAERPGRRDPGAARAPRAALQSFARASRRVCSCLRGTFFDIRLDRLCPCDPPAPAVVSVFTKQRPKGPPPMLCCDVAWIPPPILLVRFGAAASDTAAPSVNKASSRL
ncbi:unnamed protein product [Eretmochelys imbricata]